jgi:indole-3-glycerol phosphate synthase
MHKTFSLIVQATQKRVSLLQRTQQEMHSLIKQAPKTVSLSKRLRRIKGLSIIAEIKQASPSSGVLRQDFNHLSILKDYEKAGVSAVSVVTEEEFFLGKLRYLKEVKEKTSLPVLRKDFIIDQTQLYQSRALGADAVLLIAKILKPLQLKELYGLAQKLGMESIVEVHTLKELRDVLQLSPKIIGINNRNLNTFKVDLNVTLKLAPLVPEDTLIVSESGISSLKDLLLIKGSGVDSVLIGESLMRMPDIKKKLEEFKIACNE